MSSRFGQKGFIRIVILIIVVLVILSFLGFDVRKILYSPSVTKVLDILWNILGVLWKLLVALLTSAWHTLQTGLSYLLKVLGGIKTG